MHLFAPVPIAPAVHGFFGKLLRWAGKRPVTIRTFDAGGDKPVPGFTEEGEVNPFLGVRGVLPSNIVSTK